MNEKGISSEVADKIGEYAKLNGKNTLILIRIMKAYIIKDIVVFKVALNWSLN